MERASFTERMFVDYSIVKKIGYNPYYPEIQSALDDPLVIDGKPYIDLASNNYLGLANDPRLCKAAKAAIDKYGISMCGTPIASVCYLLLLLFLQLFLELLQSYLVLD